jgi:hypothetical protein
MKQTLKVLALLGAPLFFATSSPISSHAAAVPQPAATASLRAQGSTHHHTVRHRGHKGRPGARRRSHRHHHA